MYYYSSLVDKGESLEEAALRELREETGYIGKVYDVLLLCILAVQATVAATLYYTHGLGWKWTTNHN